MKFQENLRDMTSSELPASLIKNIACTYLQQSLHISCFSFSDVVRNFRHPVKSEAAKAKEAKGKPPKRKKKDAKKVELDKKLNPSCNEVRLAIINLVKPSYKVSWQFVQNH